MKTMTTSRRNASIGLVGGVVMLALILTGIRAHPGLAASGPQPGTESGQIIKSRVDLITSDVFVRDDKGMFVADLKKEDFEIYEDGVPQSLITLTLSHGGRVFNLTSPPAASAAGIVVPPSRLPNNSGRIFLLFVDDLHLNFMQTGRIRALFKELAERVVHDGDMFGIVSTGPSSLAIDLTYDRKRLNHGDCARFLAPRCRPGTLSPRLEARRAARRCGIARMWLFQPHTRCSASSNGFTIGAKRSST